jgi:tRNA uridine 5-carbamoylmethylation protein Kti12
MVKIVIIRGPLAVGKSTIAKMVAKQIKGKYYSVDDVLAEHQLDVIPEGEPCIPEKNFIKAANLIMPDIKVKLAEGVSVVIDGNFYHKGQVEHLQKELSGYKFSIFTLKAPVELCIERDSRRVSPHGKWAAIAVHTLVSKFDLGKVIGNFGTDAQEVVKKIMLELN